MELPDESKNSPKRIIAIQIDQVKSTRAVIFSRTRRSGGRTTTILQARPVSACRWLQTQSQRARLREAVTVRRWAVILSVTTTYARTSSWGGGIALTLSSVSEDSEEEEADTQTERAERAGEGADPCHASHPNETSPYPKSACGTSLSGKTPYRTHVDRANQSQRQHTRSEHSCRWTNNRSRGCHRSGRANSTPAAINKDPTATSHCARDPDRLRNSLARSGKEDVSQGIELPQLQGQAPPSTRSCRDPGKQQLPPHNTSGSAQAANSFP